jgi:aspartyl-tRNA(Asn)/glutamyl-tRNA(Gln) amidotransferase subunit A
MSDLHHMGVAELAALLQTKQVSAVEVATRFLARLGGNPHNAFLDVNSEVTLEQARASDAKLAAGTAGPLEGVPIAHKDVFVTKDFVTTAGSNMLRGYRSPFDATVVRKLREAGMVTLGKLNCDEFAMGSSNENSAFGAVSNPWETSHVPGGSSGGSAAAVAARLTPAASGTDTGGSIRQPAAFCGITGIKPTYGRASRYGMVAYASSLDQAGPMARSAEDCALLLSAMCGPDVDRDSTSLDVPAEDFSSDLLSPLATAGREGGPLVIGVPEEWSEWSEGGLRNNDVSFDVLLPLTKALHQLIQLGAKVKRIHLADGNLAIPVYYIVACAEASSNLSRFDGVKFGHRAAQYGDLLDMYQKTRSEGFGAEVKRRIMTGAYVLSHGYYDAYYLQAQKIRRMIADDFQRAFAQCDVIAGPVAPTTAWKLGEKADDPVANYLADIFTLPASLAGLPCMSLPVGLGEGNMPVGMQLIGNSLDEARLLNVAHQFQMAHPELHNAQPGSLA